ncbi:MAG: accessory Sec system glycosyltransferase Asp1 [Streptococcus salivarius]
MAPEGFIGMIRYYKDEQIIREDIYDDRGFISSSLYYEGGQSYRNYLNAKGSGSFVISLMAVEL